ncbi:V4R domain-containing protein [Pseudoduganella namucuonensis]|uniref:V4R domain-containing protein n=1 Tax=Pseudoduganella namucuonensis TaxID=1035707 RepID=A0A1I7LP29_9BURK|nr:V4R domain-containing protein [Pseudoduganella namucuonensis]SFV11442.1 V4R domain-containing protein [Pseudoduganella namucuonensis]
MSVFKDRLRFDEQAGAIHDADRRYLLMRADVLMGMLHELPPATGAAVLEALAASTRKHGGKSLAAYLGAAGRARLRQTVIDSAAGLGWGVWRITGADGRLEQRLELEVENSPFVQGHGPSGRPVCAPINGILHSLAGVLLDGEVAVTEHRCAAQHGGVCRFSARRLSNF